MNILITGGHTGIGLELSKRLMEQGHSLGWLVRNTQRGNAILKELGWEGQVHLFAAELDHPEQIQTVTEQVAAQWDHLDVLYNNAGVLNGDFIESPQGFDQHYQVNTLAPLQLTYALKPLLDKSASPRVVNTATASMNRAKRINLDANRQVSNVNMGTYMNSKFLMTLSTKRLASQWQNFTFVVVNPGANKTKMTGKENPGMRNGIMKLVSLLQPLLFKDPSHGGDILLEAGMAKRQPGFYLLNETKWTTAPSQLNDADFSVIEKDAKRV